jgi:geranylgeranyl pyrophosphate synthase
MDDDEYRRGKPTVHVKFGETTAVLAGDSLLNLSYELLSDGLVKSTHKDAYAKAVARFSSKTGANGLIGGQIIDTCISNKGKEDVFYIYKHKTGDLFAASCECAAILCGDDDKSAEEFGYALGQLFQATDDALDDDNLSAKKILNEQEFEDLLNKSKEKCISLARKYNDDFLITLVDKIVERKN